MLKINIRKNMLPNNYGVCNKCGTINFFDGEIMNFYGSALCYHCGKLVDVPIKEDLISFYIKEDFKLTKINNRLYIIEGNKR